MTLRKLPWDLIAVGLLAMLPLIPGLVTGIDRALKVPIGSELTTLFIMAILALGLNVVVGYTGLLHGWHPRLPTLRSAREVSTPGQIAT